MKYNSWRDLHPEREKPEQIFPSNKLHLDSRAWPTVDELEDIIAPMTADTVLQILHGQGIYWGWEVISHAENEIRNISKLVKVPNCGYKPRIKPEINPYRQIRWRDIPKMYQQCIRIIMYNKRCTRRQAQEQFLPQVMSIKQVMK